MEEKKKRREKERKGKGKGKREHVCLAGCKVGVGTRGMTRDFLTTIPNPIFSPPR